MSAAPAWVHRGDLVVCVGGPRDGRWYFAADLDVAEQAATTIAARTGRPLPRYGYRPTGRTRGHPHHAAVGQVHAYQRVHLEQAPWQSRHCALWDDHDGCVSELGRGVFPGTWAGAGRADIARCACSCHPATTALPSTALPVRAPRNEAPTDVRPPLRRAG